MQQYPNQPQQQPQTFPSDSGWDSAPVHQTAPQSNQYTQPSYQQQAPYQQQSPYQQQTPYQQQMPYQQQAPMTPAPFPLQAQPPKKSRTWLWIVALVLVFFVGFGVGRVGTGTPASPSGPQTTATTPAGNEPAPTQANNPSTKKHFKVGETAKVGTEWEVTVTSAKTSEGGEFQKPDAGKIYLLIEVIMKNISNKTQSASALLQFEFRDEEGQEYNMTFLSSIPSSPGGKVEPGAQTKGTIPYEVPADKKTYTLSAIGSLFDKETTIWDIKL